LISNLKFVPENMNSAKLLAVMYFNNILFDIWDGCMLTFSSQVGKFYSHKSKSDISLFGHGKYIIFFQILPKFLVENYKVRLFIFASFRSINILSIKFDHRFVH
jgi:hypothetical protein